MLEINSKKIRMWSRLGARGTFGQVIDELAGLDDRFMVLSADLGGSSGLKHFMESYPDRFINVGIAEQNMVSIAAGIAREGIPTFATSFAPFASMRACEQIRMDAAYMNTDIKVVGIGSGVSMGYLGNSHYGLEDVAVLRGIPNLTIISPADGAEIAKTVEAAVDYNGPIYIRLTGSANMPIVYKEDYSFEIGKAVVLREGKDAVVFSCGSMVSVALKAAEKLIEKNVQVTVIDVHTIKPLDKELIKKYISGNCPLFTIEEHVLTSGLGTAIAEVMAEEEVCSNSKLVRVGLPDEFLKAAAYESLLDKYGLTAEKFAEVIYKNL